jgi:hypothetical protein
VRVVYNHLHGGLKASTVGCKGREARLIIESNRPEQIAEELTAES